MQIGGLRVAITGVGGFIGQRIAERALLRGAKVRGLESDAAALARAQAAGVEALHGDVCEPADVERLVREADLVIHTAAIVAEGGDRAQFERVNVGGTRNVVEAAVAARVPRLIQLSSVMVYGFEYPANVDEDGPLKGHGNPYCETKIESEQLVLASNGRGQTLATVLRPGDVYGRGSRPWVVRPFELIQKRLFVLVDRGRGVINHVHVDNLVDALFAAVERNVTGCALNVTDGRATSVRDYFAYFSRMLGRTPPLSLPANIARPMFALLERGSSLLGIEPPARASAIDYLLRRHRYSITRAERELGYSPRISLEQGMLDVEVWLRETGRLRP